MKNKLIELEVDFIGDGKSLTKEEEMKISEFIRNQKDKNKKKLLKSKPIKKLKEKI
jgi:hypothetical protein